MKMTPTKLGIILIIICVIAAALIINNIKGKSAAIIDALPARMVDNDNGKSEVDALPSAEPRLVPNVNVPILAGNPPANPTKEEVTRLVKSHIKYYKIDPELTDKIIATIDCESDFRQYDKSGNILTGQAGEKGIAQFRPTTFSQWSKFYGLMDADIENWKDQIKLMTIMFGAKKWRHWACSPL